jgi:hypothetical protein
MQKQAKNKLMNTYARERTELPLLTKVGALNITNTHERRFPPRLKPKASS